MHLIILPIVVLLIARQFGALINEKIIFPSNSAASEIVGITIIMLLITNLGYLGIPIKYSIYLVIGIVIVMFIVNFKLIKRRFDFVPYIPFLTGYFLHIYPLLSKTKYGSIILDSGDLSTYISLGNWLTNNAIKTNVVLDQSWNILYSEISMYQAAGYRIGVPHLFALFLKGVNGNGLDFFMQFSGILIGFQCIAVYLLCYYLFSESKGVALSVSIAYSLSPVLHWTGYASFLPQIFGLTLGIVFLAFIHETKDFEYKKYGIGIGVLGTGILCGYNEVLPIIGLIMIIYLTITMIRKELPLKKLLFSMGIAGLTMIIIYPAGILPAFRGLLAQLQGHSHGGEQIINLSYFLGSLFGLIPPPLTLSNEFLSIWNLLSTIIVIVGIIIMSVFFFRNREKRVLFVSVLITMLFMIIYIILKFDNSIEKTWNLFKVINYFNPLMIVFLFGYFTNKMRERKKERKWFYMRWGLLLLLV